MPDLLPVAVARDLVLRHTRPLAAEDVPIPDALDRVLAADVTAATDVPPFRNSAMDGFALRAGAEGRTLRIVGESRAGHPSPVPVADGEAVRISTGAALPDGADAVVMVERTCEVGRTEVLVEVATDPGQNVRDAGDDMRLGTVPLTAGAVLGPAALGVAITAGLATVRCARRPRVAILGTGDELVDPGTPLRLGQIHDSNAIAIAGLVAREGGEVVARVRVPDTADATGRAVRDALEVADVVVSTGGVSVGAHDHVKGALAAAGVEERFWRVALRPGKPTWFGTRDDQLVFGLPGNPVSAMVTFLLFAAPALRALQGAPPLAPAETGTLAVAVPRHARRDEMVRVTVTGGVATPTGPQGSHVLTSMLHADALARIPMGEGDLAAGSAVEIQRI